MEICYNNFFFKKSKWNYITTPSSSSQAQGVPRRPLKVTRDQYHKNWETQVRQCSNNL